MLLKYIGLTISLGTVISCSSFVESTRKSLLDEETPRKQVKKESKWVSKSQYDDLMVKYKTLNDKYERLKDEKLTEKPTYDQINELAKSNNTETVDVFGQDGETKKISTPKVAPVRRSVPNSVEEEVSYYKKATALEQNGKTEEALKLFQFLENSTTPQLKVRAKLHIGNIYFSKKQYDLSLQVYEDIIRNHAFSSVVLDALSRAAISSRELGLTDKTAQYQSLLKDVFGLRV